MSTIDAILAEVERFTPRAGRYHVVGLDEFERPGEMLYLIGAYTTRAEAEDAAAARRRDDPDEIVHVYGADAN